MVFQSLTASYTSAATEKTLIKKDEVKSYVTGSPPHIPHPPPHYFNQFALWHYLYLNLN